MDRFKLDNWMTISKSIVILGFAFLGWANTGFAQVKTDTLTTEEAIELQNKLNKELNKKDKKVRIQVLPVFFTTPETRAAFGAVGIFSFKFNRKDTLLKVSQISASFIYTLNKQVMSKVAYDLNPNKNWNVYGDLGYFVYPYFFAGIGNAHNGEQREWYDATFPFLSANVYRKAFHPNVEMGVKYRFQQTDISFNSPSVNVPGSNGSSQSMLGLGARFDSRDFMMSATKGWFVDFSMNWNSEVLGGSYQDEFITFDVRKYFQLSKKQDVLALQVYSEFHSGDVPFNLMAMLGGSRQMRGYQQGVYRDKQMIVYQAEYRSRMFFKYFGFAVFGNYGGIGNDLTEVNKNYRYTYGAGLRFTPLPEKRYFIRFDYGRGENTQGFYIEVGEAF